MNSESKKRSPSFFIIHHSSFIVFFFVFALTGCSQQKKPFSNPKLYADPPPQASVPAAIVPAGSGQAPQAALAPAAGWTATVTERAIPNNPNLHESIWTITRPPHDQHDYIAVHRIVQVAEAGNSVRPVFFFLPGPHHHGDVVAGAK